MMNKKESKWRTSASKLSKASAASMPSNDSDSDLGQSDNSSTKSSNRNETVTNAEFDVVMKWKYAVLLSFFTAAAFVVCGTYVSLSKDEKEEFEIAFNHLAGTMNGTCHLQARNVIEGYKSMATTITSHALTSDSIWPFVSIPYVETHLSHLREETYTEFVGFSPIVEARDKEMWENFSIKNQHWIQESREAYRAHYNVTEKELIPTQIHIMHNDEDVIETSWGPYAPMWQMSPPPLDVSVVNHNIFSNPKYSDLVEAARISDGSVLSGVLDASLIFHNILGTERHKHLHREHEDEAFTSTEHPHTVIIQPVYDTFGPHGSVAGFLEGVFSWDSYFMNVLPVDVNGITAVLENTCNQSYTFEIHGHEAHYIGIGDFHDTNFDLNRFGVDFPEFDGLHSIDNSTALAPGQCHYRIFFYPTSEFRAKYNTSKPEVYTTVIALTFIITFLTFHVFTYCVDQNQKKLMITAQRTNTIVSTLFPQNVRERVMKDVEEQVQTDMGKGNINKFFKEAPKQQLKSYLDEEEHNEEEHAAEVAEFFNTKPIADFFPAVTVLFADIVGFTAWSSVREPSQVFQLLETIYFNFDVLAKRRRVFKVETVGDCYVAATGLPDPRHDHAILMARFARECMVKMQELTRKLEETLGPDTGELTMRFGLHSGPVTAGVLRGEKSRFQLFGDTMNTASRIETTGARDRIHISQETADLLIAGGKTKWVTPRENKVVLKGKGEVRTYWLSVLTERAMSMGSSSSNSTHCLEAESQISNTPPINNKEETLPTQVAITDDDDDNNDDHLKKVLDPKMERLVKWNVDQVIKLLKPVVARRNALKQKSSTNFNFAEELMNNKSGSTVLDEVKEIIELPTFDATSFKSIEDPDMIELSSDVTTQLHDYVRNICKMYRENNPFHNFEHASHVTMSVCKLLSRITAPSDVDYNEENSSNEEDASTRNLAAALHDHTYGITSDPLTQFAVAFSALIHDVDHSGVPNAQLIKENSAIASLYNNKSVAEQNSVDLAWNLLMTDDYAELRSVIYTNKSEYLRFRQLTVNSVMATDIVDKELKELRNSRWAKAFDVDGIIPKSPKDLDDDRNRKATIVIEHLIQASDVAHTMQHWHIYRKWNERFFREMYLAYKTGRSAMDPSVMWYKGEIGFFDFYIIPLARKLKDCGVFGVSSDECLNFALMNRAEWVSKGEFIVEEMLETFTKDFEQGKIS